MVKKEFIIFNKSEGVVASWLKDSFTLFMLLFCIHFSRGDTWWIFITSSLFILFIIAKTFNILAQRKRTFSNKKDLLEYINSLEE
jgi:hypothetical protein